MKQLTLRDASQKTDAVIADYLQAIEAGNAPDRDALMIAHPSVQSGLKSFFSAYDLMHSETHVAEKEVPSAFTPGLHLGRHCLVRIIGSGTFGTVWLGFDSQLKRPVAIKVPNRKRFSSSRQRESFLSEAQLVAKLEHPSIVPIYDVGETDSGEVYLVSRFIAGVDLASEMDQHSFSCVDTARCVAVVAGALAYAHEHKIVHRDVKPSNILIDTASRQPFVTDFGLAQQNSSDREGSAQAGTPAYMSPEQASGESLDHRSDIFSLGVVFYQLLTGSKPFQGDNAQEYMSAIRQEEPKPLLDYRSDLPAGLQAICSKALSKSRDGRYASADQLQHDLEQFIAAQPDSDTDGSVSYEPNRDQLGTRSVGSTPTEIYDSTGRGSAGEPTRVRRSSIALVVLSLIAIVAISYAFLGDHFSAITNQASSRSDAFDTITADQRTAVATLGESQVDTSAITDSVDRQIAIEVLELGGSVEFSDEDKSYEVSKLADMPSGPVLIEWIMFYDCEAVDDDFVANWKSLTNLQGIDLHLASITDAGLLQLAESKSLAHVYLFRAAITDVGASAIAKLPHLAKLVVAETSVGNETLKHLAGSSSIQRLDLADTKVDDDGMRFIANCKHLSDLDVEGCRITDVGLKHLGGLHSLRQLELDETEITVAGLRSLKDCPLSYLELPLSLSQEDFTDFMESHPDCEIVFD